MFSVENAGDSWASLQRAVDRVVAIIQADPHKDRTDRIITRWIKRQLKRLGADVHLDQLNSLVEDKDMLAENLENLVKKERLQGEQAGIQRGRLEGRLEGRRETLVALIELKFGPLPGWAAQRINHAESDQLDTWTKGILTAESLEVLLGKH